VNFASKGLRARPDRVIIGQAREGGGRVMRAFVLIQTEVGLGGDVARRIRSLDHVGSVEVVTGPYDLVVRAEATSIDELGKLVLRPIQEVRGIIRTMTCPVIER
jgi:DNA-binding Lrp family transcriptional regulator